MKDLIEPSNADLGDTPDSVREYLQAIEAQSEAQQSLIADIQSLLQERDAWIKRVCKNGLWVVEEITNRACFPIRDLKVIDPALRDLWQTLNQAPNITREIEEAQSQCRELSNHTDEWLCNLCHSVFPFQAISPRSHRCKKCNSIMRPSSQALRDAQDRVFDLLLGDDGQASKEAERYLERSRPDLHERLQRGSSNG